MLFRMDLAFFYEFLYLISIFRFHIRNRKTSGRLYMMIVSHDNFYHENFIII